MKIRSKINSNVGTTLGGKRVLFPAQGVIELDDKEFKNFLPFIEKRIELGKFEWVKKPAMSAEEKAKADAIELAKAKALVNKAAK